ncbi:hypothetical protein [Methylosinus sporium]
MTKEGLKALAPLGRLVIYGSLERWDSASASMLGAAAISRI